jgi:hypothetical protein
MKGVALTVLAVTGVGGFAVTTLPRPPFPGPVGRAGAAKHLLILSSRNAPPRTSVQFCGLPNIPRKLRGVPLQQTLCSGFALYGQDGASARYLLRAGPNGYAFDFVNYVWPPRIKRGEREFVYEEIEWAREANGILYAENSHLTYASSSYNRNAYITALNLKTKRRLWRSPALVANAKSFVVAGPFLITGYGFTAEPDYLYLLSRRTGRVVERLKLPSAPERITWKGDRLLRVRTYDHILTVQLQDA